MFALSRLRVLLGVTPGRVHVCVCVCVCVCVYPPKSSGVTHSDVCMRTGSRHAKAARYMSHTQTHTHTHTHTHVCVVCCVCVLRELRVCMKQHLVKSGNERTHLALEGENVLS